MKSFIFALLLSVFAVSSWAFPLEADNEVFRESIRTGSYRHSSGPINDSSWKVQIDGKEYKCDYSNTGSKEIICK